jgi:hypothetical protein
MQSEDDVCTMMNSFGILNVSSSVPTKCVPLFWPMLFCCFCDCDDNRERRCMKLVYLALVPMEDTIKEAFEMLEVAFLAAEQIKEHDLRAGNI